jgi:hypothetical protein
MREGVARLRVAGLIAAVAGAAGSVALMLYAGRRNPSRLLLGLFVVWVLSPFVALIFAEGVTKRWPVVTRASLYSLMLIVALGSLAIYAEVAFNPPPKMARFFLIVPAVSWLLSAVVLAIGARSSARSEQH